MNAEVIEAEVAASELIQKPIVAKFELDETVIVAMNARVAAMVVTDKQSRALAWDERQAFRQLRLTVTRRQEALTEDAKAQIKQVKEVATVLLGLLTPGEDAIVGKIAAYDATVEAAKKAAEAARIAEVERRLKSFEDLEYSISPYKVERMSDAEFCDELEKASVKFRDVLAARVEAKAKAEEDRLKAIAEEKERAEALRIEREQLAAERKKLQAERDALKAERDAKQRIEDEAKAEANRVKLEAENAKRLEALMLDNDKVRAFGVMMNSIEYPSLYSLQGKQLLFDVNSLMEEIVKLCKEFQS